MSRGLARGLWSPKALEGLAKDGLIWCRLDLRFVPDEQSFEGRQPRDVATSIPPGYAPPPAFATAALQHTQVKLTWDADDVVRKRTLARRLTQEQLHEDDFRVGLLAL